MKEQKGRCVFSGALTTGRLGNGDFMCTEYIEGLRQEGKLELTDAPRPTKAVAEGIPEGFRLANSEG